MDDDTTPRNRALTRRSLVRLAHQIVDERFEESPTGYLTLQIRELWWRFFTANIDRIVLAGIAVAIALLMWWVGPLLLSQLLLRLKLNQPSSDAGSKAVSVVTSLTTLIVGFSTFARASALSGSARAAQTFVQAAVDPMAPSPNISPS